MIAEGEKFAEEDQLHKKKTETLNNISAFLATLRGQLADKNGMGGKLEQLDKKELHKIIRTGSDWLDDNTREASLEDLEEKLLELQSLVNPITSKLYAQAGAGDSDSYIPEEEADFDSQDKDFDPRDHGDL